MRRNGCFVESKLSLNPHQCSTYVVFSLLLVGFFTLFVPLVHDDAIRIVVTVLFVLVTTVVCVADILCTFTNPVDDNVAYKELMTARGETYDDKRDSKVVGEQFYCVLCQASVGRRSKHCRACDKCVCGFDHHCKWLNNCVGARNYKSFFVLITFTLTMIGIQFAVVLGLFICCFTDSDFMEDAVDEHFGGSLSREAFAGISAGYLVVLLVIIALIGELFCFHIILNWKGMTTYDYILAERDRKEAPKPQSSDEKGGDSTNSVATKPPGFQMCCQNRKVGDVGMPPKRKKVSRNMLRLCFMENPNDKSSAQAAASSGAESEPSSGWSAVGAMDDHSKESIHTITMEQDSSQPSSTIEHEDSTPTIGMTPLPQITSQAAVRNPDKSHAIAEATLPDASRQSSGRNLLPPLNPTADKPPRHPVPSSSGYQTPERRPSIELQLSRQSSPANSMGTSAFGTPLGTPSGVKVSCSATSVANGDDKDETSSEEGDLSPPTREGATLMASPGAKGKPPTENTSV